MSTAHAGCAEADSPDRYRHRHRWVQVDITTCRRRVAACRGCVAYIVASPGVSRRMSRTCVSPTCRRRVREWASACRQCLDVCVKHKLKLCSRIASPGAWELWREKVRSEKDSGLQYMFNVVHNACARGACRRHCGRPGDG